MDKLQELIKEYEHYLLYTDNVPPTTAVYIMGVLAGLREALIIYRTPVEIKDKEKYFGLR